LEFIEEISKYPPENIVYVDESGIKEYMYREKAWAKKGEKIIGEVPGRKFQGKNLIAGWCMKKIHAAHTYKENTNTERFEDWLENKLLLEVGQGKVIVLDNASFHKGKEIRKKVEKAGCTLIYLPPYSPDLNPIEKYWGSLKREVRSIAHNFTSLEEVLEIAFLKSN